MIGWQLMFVGLVPSDLAYLLASGSVQVRGSVGVRVRVRGVCRVGGVLGLGLGEC